MITPKRLSFASVSIIALSFILVGCMLVIAASVLQPDE